MADSQMETCHNSKIKIVKVESYLEQSSQSNILLNALADHEMKLEASQKDCKYEAVFMEKEEDLFDKDFWENLCKKENNPKGFSNSSEDGDPNESLSSYLMTDLEENNTKNCYLDDTSSKDGINYSNSDNDSDFDDNELDYLPLSSVMNDHTYMCPEVNIQGTNYIISKSEDLKKTINSYLAGKIKKENKNAVELDTFVNSIMKKISAFDFETGNKTTSVCLNTKEEAEVTKNIEEKSSGDNESNKNKDSSFKFLPKSVDLNLSCDINLEPPSTLTSEKESNADCNGSNFEDVLNIPETQNSEYKTEISDTDNDFKPLSSLSLTNAQIFSEALEELEENCDNINKNIIIGGEENDIKNSITNQQDLLSKSSIDSGNMSIKQLSEIAKKISEDCLLFDTSKSQLDNEQFAIAKLEEFKNYVFEICKITSTEMGVQTEKVVSKKMLRKINEKEKRMLLQESSSNDSSSSYYDNDDDEETNSSFSNDDTNQLKCNSRSERDSVQSFESLVNASSRNSSDSRHEIVSATSVLAEAIGSTSGSKEMDGVESETMAFNDGLNRFPNIKFDSKISEENLGSSLLQNDRENLEFNEDGKLPDAHPNTKESTSDIKTEMSDLLSFDNGNKKRNSENSLNDRNIKPLEEMTKDEIEQYEDNERDKQIEKLIDFKGLSKRKASLGYTSNDAVKSKTHKAKKSKNFFDILDECDEPLSDESLSQEEKEIMTEKQYLKKCNDSFKQQLLDSSSDSELAEESPDDLKKLLETDEEDEEHPPLVEKFLKTFDSNNMDNVEANDDHEDLSNSLSSSNNEKINSLLDTECVGSEQIKEEKNELYLSSPKSHISDTPTSANADGSSDCEILDDSLKKKTVRPKSLDKLLADADRRKKIALDSEFISLSSDSDTDTEEQPNEAEEPATKRFLKPMLRQDQLTGGTRTAQKQENSRLSRLEKKNQAMTKAIKDSYTDVAEAEKEVILDYNTDNKTFIKVHPDVVKYLKPHQVEGIKFMYDNCYGSVENLKKHPGSGCILAHCMGLGKTLQLIALLHTVISYRDLKTSKVLVLCPKSTVMNWADEVQRWVGSVKSKVNLKVYSFSDTSDINEKLRILEEWSLSGSAGSRKAGVLLIGYEAFRTLVFFHSYKKKRILSTNQIENIKDKIKKSLLEPGADLVVCDEGHIIKNERSAISLAVAEIRTPRRIVLTGTPIQNNLKEYYSMVNFIKPSFLGTSKEFANLYANPIKNGQHKDSSKRDIKVMKQRSFVLHKKLSKFVQRKEAALLKSFLPQKFEYVLFLPLTDVQIRLYERILEVIAGRVGSTGKSLITDYTCFRKIWTHPKVLENAWKNAIQGKNKRDARRIPSNNDDEDDQPDDIYDRQTGVMSVTNDWWREYVTQEDLESILPSTKLRTMFEIIRMCEENGEKCLIFSAFVAVLNVVEDFFNKLNKKDIKIMNDLNPNGLPGRFRSSWVNGVDYYRLDGKTPKTIRHEMIKSFNSSNNTKARVFLISAKAGGQGINLIGANRVIILDTSWNPSNDQQNIFRIFRLGQKKNCYVYRLLAMGTMEEKVYSRSVTKQAMSFRVVDEQQIERHYNMEELTALYTLTKPDYGERPTPTVPQDNILANLVRNHPQLVYKYHEHDSLLENKVEQELSEQEKADAWAAYENELKASSEPGTMFGPYDGLQPNFGMAANGNYNPGVGYNPLNYPFGLASQLAAYNFPVSSGSYLDILNSMYSQYPSSPLMYSGMGSPYNSSMLPSTSNPLANPNVASLLHNVANPLTALGSLAFNGMDASTRITNSGNSSSTYGQPMFSTAALPYPMTGSSASPNLSSTLGISPTSILESFQRRPEGMSSNVVNKNIPPSELFARTSLSQNVRPTLVQQSTINVTKPQNIEQTLASPVAVNPTVSQMSTTQSNSLSSLQSQQRITVRSPSSMTSPVVASSTLPQQNLLGKPNSPPQSAANVPLNANNSKNVLGESIPISVIQKSDTSIKAAKDNNISSIQIASKQTSPVNNSVVGNKLPPLSGLEGTKLTNVLSLKIKTDSARTSNMGVAYPNKNSPKPAAASLGNMGIVYPKNGSPQSVSGQIKTSSPTVKTGSSMQIIPTRSSPQDSLSKQLEQISPSISLTAVNPQNKTTFRPVRNNQNSNLIIKSVNSTTAPDSPGTTPQKSIKTRVVAQQNVYQKKPLVNNVEKKATSNTSPTSTTYFTPTISPSRNQPTSKQITVKRNVVENIQKAPIANTKLIQNQALSKVQPSKSLQTINTRTGQSTQSAAAAAVINKRIQNTVINKNTKTFESPNKVTTTINRPPNNLQKQISPNNNLNNKRVLAVGPKSAQFVTENKLPGSIQKPQQLQQQQMRPLIKRIELNPTSLAAVKNSINSNPPTVNKSPQPGVLILDKNSKNSVNGMSYNNITGAKSGGAIITRVVNVNKRPAGPTNLNDSPTQVKRAKFSDFLPTSPKYSNTVSESLRKVQATNSLTIVPSISSQTLKVVNKKAPPAEIVELD